MTVYFRNKINPAVTDRRQARLVAITANERKITYVPRLLAALASGANLSAYKDLSRPHINVSGCIDSVKLRELRVISTAFTPQVPSWHNESSISAQICYVTMVMINDFFIPPFMSRLKELFWCNINKIQNCENNFFPLFYKLATYLLFPRKWLCL